jgi:hypothetical protein
MTFADGSFYNVLEAGTPIQVTLKSTSGSVQAGRLIGYSSGWVLADDSTGVAAKYVALASGESGEQIAVAQEAVVAGVTGATAGALVYLAESGGYLSTAGNVLAQPVGRQLNATTMAINLANYEPATLLLDVFTSVTDTYVPISNATNLVHRAISGDTTLANTGALTIGTGKITVAKQTATAKKEYARTLPAFDIDSGAADFDQVLLVPAASIEITSAKVVYTHAPTGTLTGCMVRVGTTLDGQEIVDDVALTSGAVKGATQTLAIKEGTVAAGATVFVRWYGIAATVAGKAFVQIEYNIID